MMNTSDEAMKWLKLGYETYGPAGARAMARAMGLRIDEMPTTTRGRSQNWTATQGGVTLIADEDSGQLPIHRGPPKYQVPRPPAACPKNPPHGAAGWHSYVGDPDVFHCGFEGYLEDRQPSPDHPVAECFYDERGQLVDGGHPYPGCKGTPDSYPASDWFGHTFLDPGGIVAEGWDALWESQRYFEDQERRLQEKLKRPYWRKYYRDELNR